MKDWTISALDSSGSIGGKAQSRLCASRTTINNIYLGKNNRVSSLPSGQCWCGVKGVCGVGIRGGGWKEEVQTSSMLIRFVAGLGAKTGEMCEVYPARGAIFAAGAYCERGSAAI